MSDVGGPSDPLLDERLWQALRSADAALPPPPAAAGLATRIRRRARRRSAVRAVAAGVGAAVVGLAALLAARQLQPAGRSMVQGLPSPSHPEIVSTQPLAQPVAAFDVAAAKAECARLEREANLHARAAAMLVQERAAWQRREWASQQLAQPGASDLLAAQRDRTAKALVDLGDALSAGPSPLGPAEAADVYREAAEKFPASREAEVARRRLQQIKT